MCYTLDQHKDISQLFKKGGKPLWGRQLANLPAAEGPRNHFRQEELEPWQAAAGNLLKFLTASLRIQQMIVLLNPREVRESSCLNAPSEQ